LSQAAPTSTSPAFAINDILIPLAILFGLLFVVLVVAWILRRLSPEARAEFWKSARVVLLVVVSGGVFFGAVVFLGQNPWVIQYFFLILLGLGLIALVIFIADRIARAARRKGRSYASFFWLSLLWSPLVVGLVVAALPFLPNDPIHQRDEAKRAQF